MSTPDLYPIPFPTLVHRMQRELVAGGPLYYLKRRGWWIPDPELDLGWDHLGRRCGTPAGPASGPHTQLAQNLVLSWLAGGRFMELKTVQVLDELEIPRPCIDVPHVGYNVEWSQELRVPHSAREYVKGWWLIHMLASALGPGLWPRGPEVIFDVSLGYDLAGIRTEKVRAYLDVMRDASAVLDALRAELPPELARWGEVPCPAALSDTVTLSTFHGCPADEIEAIAGQTLEWGWNTVVKLNPTLHGLEGARGILDRAGYGDVRLDPHAFEADLQWAQLTEMLPRLKAKAAALGLGFGVKLSNTLVCKSPETELPGDEVYLSGPPLHLLAFTLAARIRAELDPALPITFSAGIDAKNFAEVIACGIGPATTCSDLLKGQGYARMQKQLVGLEKQLRAAGAQDIAGLWAAAAPDAALQSRAASVLTESAYSREKNSRPPRKIDSRLVLLDCLTCDKCVPVCPNAANFTFPVPEGAWRPGLLRWNGGDFSLAEGAELRVEKRHQIGNTAEACNLCGQCDVWCPEYGGPYLVKPTLFVTERAFLDHPGRDGVHVPADRSEIRWRREGAMITWRPEPADALGPAGGTLSLGGGGIRLRGDAPVESWGVGELDLTIAVTLRLFLDGLGAPDSDTWMPPLRPKED